MQVSEKEKGKDKSLDRMIKRLEKRGFGSLVRLTRGVREGVHSQKEHGRRPKNR